MSLTSILSWALRSRVERIERFKKDPLGVQKAQLSELVRKGKRTQWGKEHELGRVKGPEDFRDRIPLSDYEGLKPYIERTMKGEKDVLWPGRVRWFAMSSGTTADRSKYIPVTPASLKDCHYKGGKDMVALYLHQNSDSNLYQGKSLVLGGSSQVSRMGSNAKVGDLSSVLIEKLPFWADLRRTPGRSVALMEDWESKIDKMARITMKEKVTNIAGVPSWTLVLLKRILSLTGHSNILDVWPELELFMHGGVSFSPYEEQFKKLIPDPKMRYVQNYNASEGFFSVQDRSEAEDMLLMLDYGIFYEFIPLEEIHKEDPRILPLQEVETGGDYALVITTNGGLWRYMIGDTVRFTNTFPFRIQVSGRTKHFINTFGEELIIDNAEKALRKACRATDAALEEYTGGPVYMDTSTAGTHEWLLEFETYPSDLEKFRDRLDEALTEVNSDYAAKRSYDLTLRKPILHALPKGAFYTWMKERGKLGGQNKVPRLANHREYLEGILERFHPIDSIR
ncbi:MAG: GH3 auxin-responsive promoter family protein [Flavobacteriales bacterium]